MAGSFDSRNAETLDAPSPTPDVAKRRQVALVEGSTPGLSGDTHALLKRRLRLAAVVMSLAFGAFLIWQLTRLNTLETTQGWVLLWEHVAVTGLLAAVAGWLYARCPTSLWKLRVAEVIVFGIPALFFVHLQHHQLMEFSRQHGHLLPISTPWIILLFTYALFIPNTWQRAAVAISAMAVAPLLVTVSAWSICPYCQALLAEPEYSGYFVEMVLVMGISATAAIVGVATIRTLRREVYEAKQLGQYHLKHLLGAGGMGEVYLAEHQLLKRPCAIKLIRPEKAGDPRTLARFEREVRATARLSHWNTVEVFDYGRTDDGTFYYVMEYLPGQSLGDLVQHHGPLPPSRVIYLMAQACEALHEAHEQGLVHRDLKPGNLFAAHRGGIFDVVKLLDFGLAKPLADPEDSGLTQEGSITGSPLFMSPEQATGEDDVDARSDIYSLGAVAFYLLTGQPPFNHEKPLKVMFAHVHEPVTPPSEIVPDIPHDLEALVMRCLEKSPEDRFQDVVHLRQALLECENADGWNRELARQWCIDYGCPKKRALDAQVMAQVAG